jgi:hypothetical protein
MSTTSGTDWLQGNHILLYHQSGMTIAYLTPENLTKFGIMGNALNWYQTEFLFRHGTFAAAVDDWMNPAERTPKKTAALTTAEKAFVIVYRQLYTGYLKGNPLVTDEDLVEMGMPKRPSGGKTPPRKPDTLVVATADTSKPAIVIVHYRDAKKATKAKPKGVHGVELGWMISDIPPVDWSQLVHSVFDTRTPIELVFTGEQRGKTLYFAMRWENTVGDKGPWSEIYSVIIP